MTDNGLQLAKSTQRESGRCARTFHGGTRVNGKKTRLYRLWQAMVGRCRNQKDPAYSSYGGRGIYVAERWMRFDLFREDMGLPPTARHSLDRIDNDGPYSPENCRWATPAEQARNKRSNRPVTFNGTTKLVVEWAEITGLPSCRIRWRLDHGWTPERALTTPLQTWTLAQKLRISLAAKGHPVTVQQIIRLLEERARRKL